MEELSGVKQAGFGRRQTGIQPIEEWFVKSVGTDEPRLMPAVFAEDAGWEKILLDQQTIDNLATLQIAGLEKSEMACCLDFTGESRLCRLSYMYPLDTRNDS